MGVDINRVKPLQQSGQRAGYPLGKGARYAGVDAYNFYMGNRPQPHLKLPDEYFGYEGEDGELYAGLKPFDRLDEAQKIEVTQGKYQCLPVHPTQLYSSVAAAFACLLLYLFWRRAQRSELSGNSNKLFAKPGCIFPLMFVFYGLLRFSIEFIRDDNPFEFAGLTISQLIGLAMIVLGLSFMAVFQFVKVPPQGD